jgi:serine/threonine protein kinase
MKGNVKIGDFGWAASSENGLRKTFCGTPLYLSPEILLGEEYDERTDIWALGILSYEMMVGSNPFQIKTQNHLQRIISD